MMASSPDNDGTGQHCQMVWVRQARREGVREKPVYERSSRANTSSNLADVGLGCDASSHGSWGTPWADLCRRPGGHTEGLRRRYGEVAGA
jgi:hypothetical protein